jgi:hypothetical protein
MSKSTPRIHASIRLLRVPALAALGCAAAAFGQPLVSRSPFMPSGSAAAGTKGPAPAYELAGSSVDGPDVSVCVYERQSKHSEWISVGETLNGIQVISFDPAHDRAEVSISGERKELSMRATSVAATTGAAPSATNFAAFADPAVPSTPEAIAHDQREARMLVSDLLEIGVQQRKAYQDAKQKASSETPAPPSN